MITKSQKERLLSLMDQVDIEDILKIICRENGYNSVTTALYNVAVEEAQGLDSMALWDDLAGEKGKAEHLKEAVSSLQSLIAKLEPAAIPSIEHERPDNSTPSEAIIDTNSSFNLRDIIFAFFTMYGVNTTLNAMIFVAGEMAANYNESQAFTKIGGKYQTLKMSLESSRDRFQASNGETALEVIARWRSEEITDLAAVEELKAKEGRLWTF